jgi:hypothetical protein
MSRFVSSTRIKFASLALLAFVLLIQSHVVNSNPREARSGALAGSGVIINEVDSDQLSTDTAEFVELFDGGAGNTPLDGFVVVFYNGSTDLSYAAFDLDGFATDADGYFTLGNAAVPGVDRMFANGILQNGPDAVALFNASASDFPNGTPITLVNLRDALVYSNTVGVDAELLALLNAGQLQINENGSANGPAVSMQRLPNGTGGERNTSSYGLHTPSPDGPNLGPTSAPVSLAGRATDSAGMGIPGAHILLEGGGVSEPRSALTSAFGYYRFDGVSMGTYMLTISSKRRVFATPTRMVILNDNVFDVDFVAEPE